MPGTVQSPVIENTKSREPVLNRSAFPMISTKANAVRAPTPGCVIRRRACGDFSASRSIACVSLAIVGFRRSSNSSKSSRRRLAQGASRNVSNCSRPCSLHSFFLQRSPSFRATACNWFIIRVRACTMRCRCHSSCRISRFSQLGTQICGKSSLSSRLNVLCILAIRLRFASSLSSDHSRIPHPQLDIQFLQEPLEPARMPTGFHAHAHLFSLAREVAIKLFRSRAVFQALLSAISRFGIHKRNLLEARVIIGTYNDHCRLLSTRAFLVGKRHQVYSGVQRAGVVMESITQACALRSPGTGSDEHNDDSLPATTMYKDGLTITLAVDMPVRLSTTHGGMAASVLKRSALCAARLKYLSWSWRSHSTWVHRQPALRRAGPTRTLSRRMST